MAASSAPTAWEVLRAERTLTPRLLVGHATSDPRGQADEPGTLFRADTRTTASGRLVRVYETPLRAFSPTLN